MNSHFLDRRDAGAQLAQALSHLAARDDTLVLALPRGGVEVADEIARALHAPLDVLVVRKLGVPGHEELAMGAIASGGIVVRNLDVIHTLQISEQDLQAAIERERHELERRTAAYRDHQPPPSIAGKTVILVDDGLATGSTMRAALAALRQQHPAHLVVAVPVASQQAWHSIEPLCDEPVCLLLPDNFYAVGAWYLNFDQVSDDEVRRVLAQAHTAHAKPDQPPPHPPMHPGN